MLAGSVVLCPGQGAQFAGMARAWCAASEAARRAFDEADRVLARRLGTRLSTLCFEGPEADLNRTDVSQPAIYTASVACWRGLLERAGAGENDVIPAAAAGLSLGEYTALHLAGAFSFEEGLELVSLRGRAMQDAAEAVPSGMVALIGADEPQARALCDEARAGGVLVCANFNAPGQVVVSGDRAACERVAGAAGAKGLRATPLPVAGAFHSPIMAPAAERLGEALSRTPVRPPRCPVLSNVTAAPHAGDPPGSGGRTIEDQIRANLVSQLTSPVRWEGCCRWLLASVQAPWHELAPGKTLAGLMRRIEKSTKVVNHDEPA